MSMIDELVKANKIYAGEFKSGGLPGAPLKKIAVVSCMDCRLSIEPMLGLQAGDAIIIRNAGGIATEDTIRSLIIACHQLGVREIMVIGHTDCGLSKIRDEELFEKLESSTRHHIIAPAKFYTFNNVTDNVREQIARIQCHPWIPDDIAVRGFVYDVQTGKITEVPAEP